MRIGISAIEVSGDQLASELIKELRIRYPQASFVGCGGDAMQQQGMEMLCHIREIEAIGIVEVLIRLIPLLRLRKRVMRGFISSKIDLFIGVDGPDFNGYMEKRLTKRGVACVHYVCPTIWVWRSGRASLFSRINKLILCLYPCEQLMIERAGGKAVFVGHPLADSIPMQMSQQTAIDSCALSEDWVESKQIVGILPGSRSGEIVRMLPVFLASAIEMQQHRPLVFLVSAVDSHKQQLVSNLVAQYGKGLEAKVITGKVQDVITASSMMMVTSGTASLEVMLAKRPMIIAYRVQPLSYWLIRLLVRSNGQGQCCLLDGKPLRGMQSSDLPLVGQPNLLAGERLVPEFLQHQVVPKKIAGACLDILDRDNSDLVAKFQQIHQALKHNAAASAAKNIATLLS